MLKLSYAVQNIELTEIQTSERIGTLPFLFVFLGFDVFHDQWDPSTEDVHPVADEGRAVQRPWKWKRATGSRSSPGHSVRIEQPKVTQSTSGHTPVDDQPVFLLLLIVPRYCSV